MYEAKIIAKDVVKGVLRLTVEFTNGVDSFEETFVTTDPSKSWMDDVIDEHLKQANRVVNFPVSEMSKHQVSETLEADFVAKKEKEKADREKEKEPKEETPKDPKEETPVVPEPVTV